MSWSHTKLQAYYQAMLNLMPILPAISGPDSFYDELMTSLSSPSTGITRALDDEFKGVVQNNTVGINSLAMYRDETRWSPALLLADGIRPDNLIILCNTHVTKVELSTKDNGNMEVSAIHLMRNRKRTERWMLPKVTTVALTSGAIGTPAILQRSGIGPSEILRKLDIEAKVINDKVGHGVDHQEFALLYKWNRYTQGEMLPDSGATGWPLSLFLSLDSDDSVQGKNNYDYTQCFYTILCKSRSISGISRSNYIP